MGSYNIKTTAQRQAMSHSEGQVVYDSNKNTLYYDDGTNWHAVGNAGNPDLEDQPTLEDVQSIVLSNTTKYPEGSIGAGVVQYAHGATADTGAYFGAVYSPNQRRIYLCPYKQGNNASWHYIDCVTEEVVAYDDPSTSMGDNAFYGGAYSPELNRIYFAPYAQANQDYWAYIDCSTGVATAYAHGAGSLTGYFYTGAVHSPTQGRIYFIPALAAPSTWHYVNCSTGAITGYSHGATIVDNGYQGGVYDPYNDMIWFAPVAISNQASWHRIDCSDGTVESYAHGFGTSIAQNAFCGGVYDPYNNYIWWVPYGVSNGSYWYYVDCSDKSTNSYSNNSGISTQYAFCGGAYDPISNRIYFAPYAVADEANWAGIKCTTGAIFTWPHGCSASDGGYWGAVFDPINSRIYYVPYNQASQTNWHYVNSYVGENVSSQLMAHSMFNTF